MQDTKIEAIFMVAMLVIGVLGFFVVLPLLYFFGGGGVKYLLPPAIVAGIAIYFFVNMNKEKKQKKQKDTHVRTKEEWEEVRRTEKRNEAIQGIIGAIVIIALVIIFSPGSSTNSSSSSSSSRTYSSGASTGRATTRSGYYAAYNREDLRNFIRYLVQGDRAAANNLELSGRVFPLRGGLTVYPRGNPLSGTLELRLEGSERTIWAPSEAVGY